MTLFKFRLLYITISNYIQTLKSNKRTLFYNSSNYQQIDRFQILY